MRESMPVDCLPDRSGLTSVSMAKRITSAIILRHLQGLEQRITKRFEAVEKDVKSLRKETHQGFEDARKHREALQEDLDATIRMVGKHEKKLARV